MAIKVEEYKFRTAVIKDAIIRVERIFGNSRVGWDSLVSVTVENKTDSENPVVEQIEEFNFKAPFNKDERGYITIYKALMEKYGGVEI